MKIWPRLLCNIAILTLTWAGTGGCRSIYYRTMETLGFPKRDILVDRVQNARNSQEEAKQQFADALEEFIAVAGYEGGDLEKQYRTLKREYDNSMQKAEKVHDRIEAVRNVAKALFAEWESELAQYQDPSLRRRSAETFEQTRQRYDKLISAMENAAAKMEPVLQTFEDQVLFLKHNLNARAIAAMDAEVKSIEREVSELIREMESSIQEADEFIQTMK